MLSCIKALSPAAYRTAVIPRTILNLEDVEQPYFPEEVTNLSFYENNNITVIEKNQKQFFYMPPSFYMQGSAFKKSYLQLK